MRKSWLATVVAVGLVIAGTSLPAQAAPVVGDSVLRGHLSRRSPPE